MFQDHSFSLRPRYFLQVGQNLFLNTPCFDFPQFCSLLISQVSPLYLNTQYLSLGFLDGDFSFFSPTGGGSLCGFSEF